MEETQKTQPAQPVKGGHDPLAGFSPAAQAWFRETFGQPTPPQAEGWPPIQRGEHTLILAPTGSGKTLAAFLWGIDQRLRELDERASSTDAKPRPDGVGLLYVSPLKALNNDIERNLRFPLEGIRAAAERRGQSLPPLRVLVRTGDTPASVRAQMVKHPPDILITTPESLYLMLTSPRARSMFRTVRSVIVDEIHTLCGNKRGAHLPHQPPRPTTLTCLVNPPPRGPSRPHAHVTHLVLLGKTLCIARNYLFNFNPFSRLIFQQNEICVA